MLEKTEKILSAFHNFTKVRSFLILVSLALWADIWLVFFRQSNVFTYQWEDMNARSIAYVVAAIIAFNFFMIVVHLLKAGADFTIARPIDWVLKAMMTSKRSENVANYVSLDVLQYDAEMNQEKDSREKYDSYKARRTKLEEDMYNTSYLAFAALLLCLFDYALPLFAAGMPLTRDLPQLLGGVPFGAGTYAVAMLCVCFVLFWRVSMVSLDLYPPLFYHPRLSAKLEKIEREKLGVELS